MHTERYAKWLPLQVKKSETDRDHRTRTRHSGNGRSFYYLNLTVIPRVLSNVQILHGCEINVLNGGKLSLEQKYIDFLDYAIVGIHKECYTDEGKEKNTDNLIACMKMRKYILSLTRMMIIHHLTMNVSFQLPNSTGSL